MSCPMRWAAEQVTRARQASGEPADFGTALHEVLERWVKEGHYLQPVDAKVYESLWRDSYYKLFVDDSLYDEGLELIKKWMERTDWTGREVVLVEVKESFMLPTSVGSIPVNYIWDRCDRLENGDIEVTDYKSIRIPITPDEMKTKIQPRLYALAAQLRFPEANRIWVTLDQLRHDSVGIVFKKEQNRETWRVLKVLAEQIIADTDPQEVINADCRYCVRKHVCKALEHHTTGGGIHGAVVDALEAADLRRKLYIAAKTIELRIQDLDAIIMEHCKTEDILGFETDETVVSIGVSRRRQIDPARAANVIGAELMGRYAKLNISNVDDLLKGSELTAVQKADLRDLITRDIGQPSIKTKERS